MATKIKDCLPKFEKYTKIEDQRRGLARIIKDFEEIGTEGTISIVIEKECSNGYKRHYTFVTEDKYFIFKAITDALTLLLTEKEHEIDGLEV